MEVLNVVVNNTALALVIIGVLAFVVSVITEVTKNLSMLNKIPTDLLVIGLSMLVTLLVYFTYVSYLEIPVQWYYVALSIIASFMVSFVAMFGWDKFTTLYDRFKK